MIIMGIREFRQKMSDVLGYEDVIITKDGIPVAKVVSLDPIERWELLIQKIQGQFQEAGVTDLEIKEMYRTARGKNA